MRRWKTGIAVASVLVGCVGANGLGPPDAGSASLKVMPADPAVTIVGRAGGADHALDTLLAGQADGRRFTLEIEDFDTAEAELTNRVFPDYRSAIAYAEKRQHNAFLPSADMVTAITKQINDGIYARLEMALEQGEGGFTAKPNWLDALQRKALADIGTPAKLDVAARLAGTAVLRGTPQAPSGPRQPQAVQDQLVPALKEFQDDPILSKPIGFFTWNAQLSAIFQRDRWLQGWFGEQKRAWLSQDGAISPEADRHLESGAHLAGLLTGDAGDAHEKILTFYKRMTNPFSGYAPKDLAKLLPAGRTLAEAVTDAALRAQMLERSRTTKTPFLQAWAILPPSTSAESELFYKLDAAGLLKPGQDRMQVLIDAIRSGQVSLAPNAESGFYAYQQHALEALLKVGSLPESERVTYGARYQKRLEEAFKTGMTKARETHAKQLDNIAMPTSVRLGPSWVVEPLPTYYDRLAASYGFLKTMVMPQFQADFTNSAKVLVDGGAEGKLTLADELAAAESLTRGLAALAKAEVGMAPITDPAQVATAAAWLKGLGTDVRLGVDTRVSVPVNQYRDGQDRPWMQYWGTAGVMLTKVKVAGGGEQTYLMATDKFLFFDRPYAAGPLNRTEYRQILDGSATLGDALKKLQGS